MIVLKFQENPDLARWAYVPNFRKRQYSSSVKEGHTISFRHCKLSKQPLEYIMKFSEYIKKFKDFTLIAHKDCSESINAKKLIEIADEVYIEDKLVKSRHTKETKMSNELRIPEDQMQRLEAIAANIQKSVGPKTWKQRIMSVLFGRVAIISMVGAYFMMSGENPKVVSFDKSNGIISVKDGDSIENLIWSDNKLMKDGELFEGKFSQSISNSIMLGLEVVGLQDDSWF